MNAKQRQTKHFTEKADKAESQEKHLRAIVLRRVLIMRDTENFMHWDHSLITSFAKGLFGIMLSDVWATGADNMLKNHLKEINGIVSGKTMTLNGNCLSESILIHAIEQIIVDTKQGK